MPLDAAMIDEQYARLGTSSLEQKGKAGLLSTKPTKTSEPEHPIIFALESEID